MIEQKEPKYKIDDYIEFNSDKYRLKYYPDELQDKEIGKIVSYQQNGWGVFGYHIKLIKPKYEDHIEYVHNNQITRKLNQDEIMVILI